MEIFNNIFYLVLVIGPLAGLASVFWDWETGQLKDQEWKWYIIVGLVLRRVVIGFTAAFLSWALGLAMATLAGSIFLFGIAGLFGSRLIQIYRDAQGLRADNNLMAQSAVVNANELDAALTKVEELQKSWDTIEREKERDEIASERLQLQEERDELKAMLEEIKQIQGGKQS